MAATTTDQQAWTSRFESRRRRDEHGFLRSAPKRNLLPTEVIAEEEQMRRIIKDATKVALYGLRGVPDRKPHNSNLWLHVSCPQPDFGQKDGYFYFDQLRPTREFKFGVGQFPGIPAAAVTVTANEAASLQELLDDLKREQLAAVPQYPQPGWNEPPKSEILFDRLIKLWRDTLEVVRGDGKLDEILVAMRLDVNRQTQNYLELPSFYRMFQAYMQWQQFCDDCGEFLEWTRARAEHRKQHGISSAPKSGVSIDELIAVMEEIQEEISSGDAAGNLSSFSMLESKQGNPFNRVLEAAQTKLEVGKRWQLIKQELLAVSVAHLTAACRLAETGATDSQRQWFFASLIDGSSMQNNTPEAVELLKLAMPDNSPLVNEDMDVLKYLGKQNASDDPTLLEYILTHQRQVFALDSNANGNVPLNYYLTNCVTEDSLQSPRRVDALINHGVRFSPDWDYSTMTLYQVLGDKYAYNIHEDPEATQHDGSALPRLLHVAVGLCVPMGALPPLPANNLAFDDTYRDPATAPVGWELGNLRLTWMEICTLQTAVCDLGGNLRFPAADVDDCGPGWPQEMLLRLERLKRSQPEARSRGSAQRFLARAAVNMEALRFLVANDAPVPRPEVFGALLQKYALPTLFAVLHMFIQQGELVTLPEFSSRANSQENLAMFPQVAGLIYQLLRRYVPDCPKSFFDELQRIDGSLVSMMDVGAGMEAMELDSPLDWECVPAAEDEIVGDLMEFVRGIIVLAGKKYPELPDLFVEYAAGF